MNELTITKKDFFTKQELNQINLSEILGSKSVEVAYHDTLVTVLDILNDRKLTKDHYKLMFAERHYPHNMSSFFWQKIEKLMKNISFDITTSDLHALTFIPRTEKGWTNVCVQYYNQDNKQWDRYEPNNYYGSLVTRAQQEINF